MKIVLIVGLYAAALALLTPLVQMDMGNEARLAFNVIGGIGVLVVPLYVYSLIDLKLTKRMIDRVARAWCSERQLEFVRTEIHKTHFTVVHSTKARQNFRVRPVPTTWSAREVEWL